MISRYDLNSRKPGRVRPRKKIVAQTFGEKMLLRRATSIAYTAAQQYSKTKVLNCCQLKKILNIRSQKIQKETIFRKSEETLESRFSQNLGIDRNSFSKEMKWTSLANSIQKEVKKSTMNKVETQARNSLKQRQECKKRMILALFF